MSLYASRYARAFADVVESAHLDPKAVDEQLSDVSAALGESADLREVLFNPAMQVERRIRIVDALQPRLEFGREVRNFLAVLLKHERMPAFHEIVTDYRSEMDRRQGYSEAEVTTARPLGTAEREELERGVAKLAGTKVRAVFRQDDSLLGGAIVRISGTVYDGSVRGRLGRLKEELINN